METKRDFFISYTSADERWATWIAAVLEAKGYSCIIQAWDFRPGGNFVSDIDNALINSKRFIAVLSPDYLTSMYCQAEWTAAFTKDPNGEKRLFIPVRVADIAPEGLFAPVHYIDLFGTTDEEIAEKRLLNGVDTKDIPRNRPSFPGTKKVRFPNSLPFNNLPYIRNGYFTGRNTVLESISKEFDTGNAVSLTQAITGLGGIGKTQTALEYAYRYAEKYDWIWWVTAENEGTVLQAYQEFALKMKLIDASQDNNEVICETVLNWMDTHEKWLFIYDNLDRVSDNTAWWPKNNRGNILITTRNQRLSIGKGMDIAVFTEEEAVSFLEKRTGICNDPENAALLSKRLGCLPLALEQAAAFIRNTITFPEYLLLLDKHGLTVLKEIDGVIDYAKPVTVTWEISFDKISMEGAKQLLYLCAYMASENIDPCLFSENTELFPSPLCDQLSDDLTAIDLWKELTRYSLLQKQGDAQNYSMHRLLQEVIRRQIGEDRQWAQCCLKLFLEVFDFKYGNIPSHNQFIKILPHVEAFLGSAVSCLTEEADQIHIAKLFAKGGLGQYHLGNYSQAFTWYQKALAIREKALGKEHPSTATTYHNIAGVYTRQGEYSKALAWYQKALAFREKVLGKEHPDTATTYNNIAGVYNSQGEYSKALEWYQKALGIVEKVLGKEHPYTAATYNNIAEVYKNQGEYSKALEWFQKALAIHEKVLGTEHPDTATTYNNIALVYDHQGEYAKALEWYQKALAIREKVLGKEHPSTAATYNNIAAVYDSQGEYAKALEWYQKALAIKEKVLGKEHPDTATTYNNIAMVYDSQSDYSKALEWYQKALVIVEKVLGKEHPSTAATYNNIAAVYDNQGEYSKALEWNQKALAIREKVLGKEHPATASTYNNIAGVYNRQGKYSMALEWYQKALVIVEKVLGKEHPDTAATYNNISAVYYNQGEYPKALEWLQKAHDIFKTKLGEDHPSTRNSAKGMQILQDKMHPDHD